jgi:hypothetical protein
LDWQRRSEERLRAEALVGLGQRTLHDIGLSEELTSLARAHSESQSERRIRTTTEIGGALRAGQW